MKKAKNVKDLSQSAFQDALVGELLRIEREGVGEHRRRSRHGAFRKAREVLRRAGYSEDQADSIIREARDVAALEIESESEE